MKILVTGGAGFIGSNFIRYVLENHPEDSLVNFDKLTYAGNLENLKDVEECPRYFFVKGDICDFAFLKKQFAGVDAVVHFAAESHVDRSINSQKEFINTNILGTQNVIDAVRYSGVKKYIHISTDEVYGDVAYPKKSKHKDPYFPSSPYSATKACSDMLVFSSVRTFGLPAIVTHCTNNYGPYQFPEKIIPLFITNLLEGKKVPLYDGGSQIRDWLFVEDHCAAIDLVLRNGVVGEVYDISAENNPEITNKDITLFLLGLFGAGQDMIENVVGARAGHDQRYAVDSSKIRNELGWKPSVSFEDGLTRTVNWYKENSDWIKNVKTGKYLNYYDKKY